MNFSALIPCFFDHLFFVSDFRQLPCQYFLKVFPILCPLLPLHPEAPEKTYVPNCNGSMNLFLLQRCDIRDTCAAHTFQSYSHRFVGIDNTSIFGLVFPNIAAGFTAAIQWCFTRHCCWHRNFPTFYERFSWSV